mgnify:CR=1 FL=1
MVEVLIGVVLLAIGGAGGWFARKLMEAAKRGARMPVILPSLKVLFSLYLKK